jgi:hypothetical protein
MRRRFCSVSLAALLFVLPAPGSTAPQASNDETIVVTGELPGDPKEQARAYVKELGVAAGEQPTARWFDPICPHAIGLGKEHAKIVEEQIRRIIREAGAPLAKARCAPNFAVAFTDGPERVFAASPAPAPRSHPPLPAS